jgi:hypothetical protein
MKLSLNQKKLLEKVVNVFETGKPEGNYSTIAIFNELLTDARKQPNMEIYANWCKNTLKAKEFIPKN